MRYKITFSYDGSCFNGLERQINQKTIQGEIEKVLTQINNNQKVDLVASGRTDKGVHANNQVAHFNLDVKIKPYNIKEVLNKQLNKEIYIKEVKEVNDNFHARYDCIEKTYIYYINTKEQSPFQRNYIYQLNHDLNIDEMITSSKVFLGKHDFRALAYQSKDKENCVRTIKEINIEKENSIIKITIIGDGFLRKMVRNIVSILIKAGEEKISQKEVQEILNSKEKTYNIKCVPACGLYLDNVKYQEKE